MKNSILGIALFLIASMPLTAQLNTNNKEFLFNYFEETTEHLKNKISGLSEKQMHFKPSEDQWSISQCIEHIILTEKMLFEMAKSELEKPKNPERKGEVKFKDEDLIEGIKDRSKKAQATDELTGEGKYNSPQEAMVDFKKQRQLVLDFIEHIQLETFRNHISDSPFGAVDAYQSMLFIAGHTARHTLQIEEIKASEEFPE
ncbi:DinB family protein [Salegentibacter salegens]|uniref:DinB superfamily protein n=1 Tax=Salegentibacter salegens TaxID=143223 RepID=A0A1M7J5Y1_9FLAO|nr:DinB family protein [Salegentibacter salegens]PRX47347.1 DinB family protein [Salegentibacter salegens]SHM48384.1 DinB superfamily protein [Salegentibacter salegens]